METAAAAAEADRRRQLSWCPVPQPLLPLLFLLLVLLLLPSTASASASVSAVLPSGSRFTAGQTVVIACDGSGLTDNLSVRLFCPLTRFFALNPAGAACFEDCRKPLCMDPTACAAIPELLEAECTESAAGGSFTFRFPAASIRHGGNYTCQYKNLRSSALIVVTAAPTTPIATTTGGSTATSPRPTVTTIISAAPTSASTRASTATSTATPTSTAVSTTASGIWRTTKTTPVSTATTRLGLSTGTPKRAASSTRRVFTASITTVAGSTATSEWATKDWFNKEIMSSLKNGHVLVAGIALLLVLTVILIVSLLCCRKCLRRRRESKSSGHHTSAPGLTHDEAAELLPLHAYQQARQQQLLQQQGPPPLPTQSRPSRHSSQSFASPVYNDADAESSAATVNYYAPPPIMTISASAANGGSFFSRGQDGRHSFHSVRPDGRQRVAPGYPGASDSAELLSGRRGTGSGLVVGVNVGGVGGGEDQGDSGGGYQEVVRLLTEQGRELQRLNQQVRASQQALSRLAASYHDLHRSVSLSRVRHPSSPRNSPEGNRQPAAATPDSRDSRNWRDSPGEDPYDAEVSSCMLPSPRAVAAAADALTAAATADDADDGLASNSGPERLGPVGTISEELEGEDTLRPRKQPRQQQQ